MAEIDEFGMFANAFHKMRIPRQSIIMGLLVLITAGSFGAPQDNWYAESDRDFGFIGQGGMRYPIDVLHGCLLYTSDAADE